MAQIFHIIWSVDLDRFDSFSERLVEAFVLKMVFGTLKKIRMDPLFQEGAFEFFQWKCRVAYRRQHRRAPSRAPSGCACLHSTKARQWGAGRGPAPWIHPELAWK